MENNDSHINRTNRITRFCSIPTCKYNKGTLDRNVRIFRPPKEDNPQRKLWFESLFAASDLRIAPHFIRSICELHFNPEDLRGHDGRLNKKLRSGTLPLPIQKSAQELDSSVIENITLVDINKLHEVPHATPEFPLPSSDCCKKEPENDAVESNECANCHHIGGQLQRAKCIIKELLIRVNSLKRSTHENDCDECELCCKVLKGNEIMKHSCVEMMIESTETESANGILDADTAMDSAEVELNNQVVPPLAESDQSPPHSVSNASHNIEPNNVKKTHKSRFKLFQCAKCDVSYFTCRELTDHLSTQHKENHSPMISKENRDISRNTTLKCSAKHKIKTENFPWSGKFPSSSLLPHMQKHGSKKRRKYISQRIHTPPPFFCDTCGKEFKTKGQLKTHLSMHIRVSNKQDVLRPKSFECFICKTHTTKQWGMRLHMRNRHPLLKRCDVCCTEMKSASHLCGKNAYIECEYCTKRFTTTNTMLTHLNDVHKNEQKLYGCTKCPKSFPLAVFKNLHQASNLHPMKRFQCEICSKRYSKKQSLATHVKAHTEARTNLCDECGKGYISATNLLTHKRNIHAKTTAQCPGCPKIFASEYKLKRHKCIQNTRKFACEHCGKQLSTLVAYRIHIKIHTRTEADRRYSCKDCSFKFFDSSSLKAHERTHLGIKKFDCQFCSNVYKHKGDLQKHLRTHLDGKIYDCSVCQMRFKYSVELEKHLSEHYKEEKKKHANMDGQQSEKNEKTE